MFYYPYFIIEKRLKEQMPALKTVDWYMQQDQKKGQELLRCTPAVYLEFDPIKPEDYANGQQRGIGAFTVYLVTVSMKDDKQRIEPISPMAHVRLMDSIFKTLNGFVGRLAYYDSTQQDREIFNSLERTNIVPPHQSSDLMVSKQRFEGLFYDYSAVVERTKIVPSNVDIP